MARAIQTVHILDPSFQRVPIPAELIFEVSIIFSTGIAPGFIYLSGFSGAVRSWESGELGIGFQFFNVFNYPNFGIPDHSTSLPSFGMIGYTNQPPTSLLGSGLGGNTVARMIQLKVQLQF